MENKETILKNKKAGDFLKKLLDKKSEATKRVVQEKNEGRLRESKLFETH